MTTAQQPADSALRTPTAKMISGVKAVAAYRGVALPEGYETDYRLAKAFLQEGSISRLSTAKKFISENDAEVLHFRPTVHTPYGCLESAKGGLTAVFRREGTILQLATAVCNDETDFNPKLGLIFAAERLANNQFIRVPLKGQDAGEVVSDMFAAQFNEVCDRPQDVPELAAALFGDRMPRVIFLVRQAPATSASSEQSDNLVGLSKKIIPDDGGFDQWHDFARSLIDGVLEGLAKTEEASYAALQKAVHTYSDADLVALLAGTSAEAKLAGQNMLASARKVASNAINAYEAAREATAELTKSATTAAEGRKLSPEIEKLLGQPIFRGLPLAGLLGQVPPGFEQSLASLSKLFRGGQPSGK